MSNVDSLAVNSLRVLSASMITKAKSGHPGICLGSAPILHTLFTNHLNIYAKEANWANRDRFVLSAGHGSALLYSLLHLSGFNISMADLANFRQKNSLTPGHPEYGHTPGVEVTTGPLGQGVATSVGFAIGGKFLANRFNKKDLEIFNFKNYCLCGDGDLQEGLVMEACSLAGHLKLNNLILLYDSNDIQLDGSVEMATSDNIKKKFEAMNWSYLRVEDGNNLDEVSNAITKANKSLKPTIIEIKTVIGYGSTKAGTNSIHGKPLTEDEINDLKKNLNYDYPNFTLPEEVKDLYLNKVYLRSEKKYLDFVTNLNKYKAEYPSDYELLEAYLNHKKIDYSNLPNYNSLISTRKVTGQILAKMSEINKLILAGSADLASSTMIKGNDGDFSSLNYGGRNINYGVREHAMGSIVNGITLMGLYGVGSGFFVFSDYMKDSIREAALMGIPSLFIFSHDTVCVGEDGPTHEPVEQLAGLRAVPNLNVVRPSDAKETTYAMLEAFKNNSYPTVITTSRQDLPVLEETNYEGFTKGGYICYEPKAEVEYILISCGSELNLAIMAAKELENEGKAVRVVSMPSQFIFLKQSKEYQESVLPKNIVKRLAVEMGATQPWYRFANNVLGIDSFGKSMPIKEIYEEYGFTVNHIKNLINQL